MTLFQKATRAKLRFTSARGELSTEQLWDLALTGAKDGCDLNTIAIATNKAIKELDEEGFVSSRATPALSKLKLKLEVLKVIIEVKLKEEEERQLTAAKAIEKQKVLEALSEHDDKALKNLSREELLARLARL